MKSITVAKSWRELNEWQIQEISHLYLNSDPEDFDSTFEKMIFVLFQKEYSYKGRKQLFDIISEVPISQLAPFAEFLLKKTDFYSFPDIPGLIKPADRIENITVRQFSDIDTFFYAWNKNRTELNLRRLVATLYRLHETYDALDLKEVSKITDKIPKKQMHAIALAFLFTRKYITDKFKIVFPDPKPESEADKLKPKFIKKTPDFVPFDKIIVGMSMDELQPLGTKQEVNQVRIYEFLSVLSETMVYHKSKNQA